MIEIIPAMDLIDGKCVRLTQGDFARKTVYRDDPLEAAKRFEAAGLRRLHIVDLDGARTGKPANLRVLERVAKGVNLRIDFGGGIKSETDLEAVFAAGAAIVNIGSLAVKQPETFFTWIGKYGAEHILLGADAKNGLVAVDGWQTETDNPILTFLSKYAERGATNAFVTDISRDGAMAGPSIELYREIIGVIPNINLISSGGVRSVEDIGELDAIGCSGVIVGKAIYEGRIKVEELSNYAG